MPASTLDPVNAALRTALSKTPDNLDLQLAGAAKKALLSNIEFESIGSYETVVLGKLKSKYIVLKSAEVPNEISKTESMGGDETLSIAKHELYPIKAVQLGWNSSGDWTVGAGMVNMGNTCYLNSTLQALFHVPALVNWLISDKQHLVECEDSGGLCIICAMRKTLQDSQQRNISSIRPFLIYNKLRLVCRNLIPGRQEDAHEFLRYLVEAMEKAYLSRFRNNSDFDARTKETTPLNQILGGYLRSTVRCLDCGHVSTTFQHFQDFLLDIRKTQTIDEAMESYFSQEKLDDESYHCESCQKKVPATKQFWLEKNPMVLCIQLKRFSVSNNKITKHVQFRQRLELTKYMRRKPSVPLVYKLVALVTHMGPTVGCGHYTAVAQAPSGNFYQFDDSMVRPISHQAMFSTNAYILLYELEQLNSNNKLKTQTSCSTSTYLNSEELSTNSIHLNGNKVYGPELPPTKPLIKTTNGNTVHVLNGNSEPPRTPIKENKAETPVVKSSQKESKTAPPSTNSSVAAEIKPAVETTKPLTTLTRSASSSSISSLSDGSPKQGVIRPKLVPYDMDDSSSCSEESNAVKGSLITTKATANEWKVTSTENPEILDKKKSKTVTELLKMSHGGYGTSVNTWNGTRSHLEKEVSNERREDRKRPMSDNLDQGRLKHPKIHSNGSYKPNGGYNPIQEYHNSKNWSQYNGSSSKHYRQFYGSGDRHRNNRRNFHHNKNYHKNYHFRQ